MSTNAKNGYEAISHVSQCFSDIQDYTEKLERELRELECANDSLHEENDRLCKKIAEISEKKSDELVAEFKRGIMETFEKMPAEEIKRKVLNLLFEALCEECEEDDDE